MDSFMFMGDLSNTADFARRRGSKDKKKRMRRIGTAAAAIGSTALAGYGIGRILGVRAGTKGVMRRAAQMDEQLKTAQEAIKNRVNDLKSVGLNDAASQVASDGNKALGRAVELGNKEINDRVRRLARRGGGIGAVAGTAIGAGRVAMANRRDRDQKKKRRR